MPLNAIKFSLPPGSLEQLGRKHLTLGSHYLSREWLSSFWLLPKCTGLVFYTVDSQGFVPLVTVMLFGNMLSVKGEGERLWAPTCPNTLFFFFLACFDSNKHQYIVYSKHPTHHKLHQRRKLNSFLTPTLRSEPPLCWNVESSVFRRFEPLGVPCCLHLSVLLLSQAPKRPRFTVDQLSQQSFSFLISPTEVPGLSVKGPLWIFKKYSLTNTVARRGKI